MTLVLMVASAAIGGTLQYGYNLAIMNAPTIVSFHHHHHQSGLLFIIGNPNPVDSSDWPTAKPATGDRVKKLCCCVDAHVLSSLTVACFLTVYSNLCQRDIPGALGHAVGGLPGDSGLDSHCLHLFTRGVNWGSDRRTYDDSLREVMQDVALKEITRRNV